MCVLNALRRCLGFVIIVVERIPWIIDCTAARRRVAIYQFVFAGHVSFLFEVRINFCVKHVGERQGGFVFIAMWGMVEIILRVFEAVMIVRPS